MSDGDQITSHLNPDLAVVTDNKSRWNLPETRRHGYQNLYRIPRYAVSFRSDHILDLETDIATDIGFRDDVQALTETTHFSGMAVAKGQKLLFEKYAPDFSGHHPHTIMSISKMVMNLICGELIAGGRINPDNTVDHYIPEIGSGYAKATVQQVLDMNLENSYSEDYTDNTSASFRHETTLGWRLPTEEVQEESQQDFLCSIEQVGGSLENTTGYTNYKSANTDLLGWIAERVSGRPLRDWILEIVEAVGIESSWHMHTDRNGFPIVDGGVNLTARDLARFGLLFCRYGSGVAGRKVGDADYIGRTRKSPALPLLPPKDFFNYSNQTMTNGVWLGHAGYGGQFMLANPDTGVAVSFFSVLENKDAVDVNYQARMVRMMEAVAAEF